MYLYQAHCPPAPDRRRHSPQRLLPDRQLQGGPCPGRGCSLSQAISSGQSPLLPTQGKKESQPRQQRSSTQASNMGVQGTQSLKRREEGSRRLPPLPERARLSPSCQGRGPARGRGGDNREGPPGLSNLWNPFVLYQPRGPMSVF